MSELIDSNLSILVVDDLKSSCAFISKILEREGYTNIRMSYSPVEALKLMDDQPADVLIADWVMPDMDGLELTQKVRDNDSQSGRYTSIILLTAKDDTGSMLKAFHHGVDDYLVKPPEKPELSARVFAAARVAKLQNKLNDAMKALKDDYASRITVDEVTGLGNRLDSTRRIEEMLQMARQRGGAVCSVQFGISKCSQLRRDLGSEQFDEVMVAVSQNLRKSIRPTDSLARVSDFQFSTGMYYPDEATVNVHTFRRILKEINMRPIKISTGFVSLKLGMGITSCSGASLESATADSLIEDASDKIKKSFETGCTEAIL